MTGVLVGQYLDLRAEPARFGNRIVERYRLRGQGVEGALAMYLAAQYVPRRLAVEEPDRLVSARLPLQDRHRLMGLGEVMARLIATERWGHEAPFRKLHVGPTREATLHGPDGLTALLVSPLEAPAPSLIEAKGRSGRITASDLRAEIIAGLRRVDDLDSSWEFALQEIVNIPDSARLRARYLARALATGMSSSEPPAVSRHAVIVCESDGIDGKSFWKGWPDEWQDSRLAVVEVPNLDAFIAEAYECAARLRYSDLADRKLHEIVPEFADSVVSHSALIRPSAVRSIAPAVSSPGLRLAIEAACWYLADFDGLGSAVANDLIDRGGAESLAWLPRLLLGDARGARDDGAPESLVTAVEQAWRDPQASAHPVVAEFERVANDDTGVGWSLAVELVGAAIRYRLSRHPAWVVPAPHEPNVRLVLDALERRNVRAFWPGQAKAISSGLLETHERVLACKLPTSAGKTTLIELVCARTLDLAEDALVVVLCPSRALVDQHASDLAASIGQPGVVGLRGGYELDETDEDLRSCRVAVMTPERFAVEIRARVDDESPVRERLALVVVDEVHMLCEPERGPRLELLLSRLRWSTNCRFVLFSSQLGDTRSLCRWLGGNSDSAEFSSDWRPAPLRRGIYFPEGGRGYLKWEHERAASVLFDLRRDQRRPDQQMTLDIQVDALPRVGPERNEQIGALFRLYENEGLVLIFAGQARSVRGLADELAAQGGSDDPSLQHAADALAPIDEQAANFLRHGVGIHYRGLHSEVLRITESKAREGALRGVVCTTTLAEGVDLPVRTLIVVSQHLAHGVNLTPSKFANLSGRAGRGGRYREGTVISFAKDRRQMTQLQASVSQFTPATVSALSHVYEQLVNRSQQLLLDPGAADFSWSIPDAVISEAMAEGAIDDAQLRDLIEAVLGRTLWRVDHSADLSERFFRPILARANWYRGSSRDDPTRAVFRLTGLPLAACVSIDSFARENQLGAVLLGRRSVADERPIMYAALQAIVANERDQSLDIDNVAAALLGWVDGVDEIELIRDHGTLWPTVTRLCDGLLPWYVSGVVEIALSAEGVDDPPTRANIKKDFAIARLRYGAPDVEVCRAIRAGIGRARALALFREMLRDHWATEDPAALRLTSSYREYLRFRSADLSIDERRKLRLAHDGPQTNATGVAASLEDWQGDDGFDSGWLDSAREESSVRGEQ